MDVYHPHDLQEAQLSCESVFRIMGALQLDPAFCGLRSFRCLAEAGRGMGTRLLLLRTALVLKSEHRPRWTPRSVTSKLWGTTKI